MFGNSAVGKGVAVDLHFTDEVDDHENTIEVGGAVINGYNRADFFAESKSGESSGGGSSDVFSKGNASVTDAAETACTNQSSLILATAETT